MEFGKRSGSTGTCSSSCKTWYDIMPTVPIVDYRGTGRSTQMLELALHRLSLTEGKVVLVVCHHGQHCEHLIGLTQVILGRDHNRGWRVNWTRREVRLDDGTVLRFITADQYMWHLHRVQGYDPRTPILIDHYTHEMHRGHRIP